DFTSAKCVADCLSTTTCVADTCDDALPISLTPNAAPVVLTGIRSAYRSAWDADGIEGCNLYEPGPGGPSAGPDLFFKFEGLVAGQQLILDAEASEGNMAFYVHDQCNPSMCGGAFAFDNSDLNRMIYPVPADGDLIVAVE